MGVPGSLGNQLFSSLFSSAGTIGFISSGLTLLFLLMIGLSSAYRYNKTIYHAVEDKKKDDPNAKSVDLDSPVASYLFWSRGNSFLGFWGYLKRDKSKPDQGVDKFLGYCIKGFIICAIISIIASIFHI